MTRLDWASKKAANRPPEGRRFHPRIKDKRLAADILVNEYMIQRDAVLYSDLCKLMRQHAKLVISQRQSSSSQSVRKLVRSPVDITSPAVNFGFNWRLMLPCVVKYFNESVSDEDIDGFYGFIRGLLESDLCVGRPAGYVIPEEDVPPLMAAFGERTRMGFVPEPAFSL